MVTIVMKQSGSNGYWQLFNQISEFVKNEENWDTLWLGADRLQFAGAKGVEAIEADYYATERIQIGKTRLHKAMGLKYANGFKYNAIGHPSQEDLVQTVKDIQRLIDAAAEVIPAPFELIIRKN